MKITISISTYLRTHGAKPSGRGRWGFIMGKEDYSFVDEKDSAGRLVVFFPTAPSGEYSANMTFAQARDLAIAEAKRRNVQLVGVAP